MKRKTNCMTVMARTMMITVAMVLPKGMGRPTMFSRLERPVAKTAPGPPAFIRSLYWEKEIAAPGVIRATTPRTLSVNMEPASTGLAAHSESNWPQVPEHETMASQAEQDTPAVGAKNR